MKKLTILIEMDIEETPDGLEYINDLEDPKDGLAELLREDFVLNLSVNLIVKDI